MSHFLGGVKCKEKIYFLPFMGALRMMVVMRMMAWRKFNYFNCTHLEQQTPLKSCLLLISSEAPNPHGVYDVKGDRSLYEEERKF